MNKFIGLYDVRDFRDSDKNFVLATFLRGLYYGDSWFSLIPKPIFMDNYKKVGEHLVTNPSVTIKIACLKEDPDVIIGYSILSADFQTIHWVFVKTLWRKHGIGRTLVPQNPSTVSHLTKVGLQLLHKLPNAIFNPFKL